MTWVAPPPEQDRPERRWVYADHDRAQDRVVTVARLSVVGDVNGNVNGMLRIGTEQTPPVVRLPPLGATTTTNPHSRKPSHGVRTLLDDCAAEPPTGRNSVRSPAPATTASR